ncbi:MAG: sulfurtransferase [Erythrobacter sp.]|jgi:thiosulfate/3-mercaptopyruvate sulfurtransferase|nr:sulfurtransferase [Erythrobacter sp.]
MTDPFPPLVSPAWLADNLGLSGLVLLDASLHLPAANRDARAEFNDAHIAGARFLDLASLTDKASPVPAALPSPAQLAERLAQLGWSEGDRVVLYDDSAVKSSARAWFALKAHGIAEVALLDGGLARWRAENRPLESGLPETAPAIPAALSEPQRVITKQDVLAIIETGSDQLLDARSADRVFGTGIDPVHGGQNGRIPGSCNLPFGEVFAKDGTFKSPAELRTLFKQAGIDLARPIVTTCGSGVTASVLLFALHLAGVETARLYDGSWQEWSADPDTPKLQGAAK